MRIGVSVLLLFAAAATAHAQTSEIGQRQKLSAGAGVGYDTGIKPGTLAPVQATGSSSYRDRPTAGVTSARTSAGTGGTRD